MLAIQRQVKGRKLGLPALRQQVDEKLYKVLVKRTKKSCTSFSEFGFIV